MYCSGEVLESALPVFAVCHGSRLCAVTSVHYLSVVKFAILEPVECNLTFLVCRNTSISNTVL